MDPFMQREHDLAEFNEEHEPKDTRCPKCGLFLCGHYDHLPFNNKCLCTHPRWLHNRRDTPQQYEECRSRGCKCTHYMEEEQEEKKKPDSQENQDARFDSWAHYNSGHRDC